MAIVPSTYGIVRYTAPTFPIVYPTPSPPVPYRPPYWYPSIFSPEVSNQFSNRILSYYDPYIGAIYNPGNFWIWPFGK